MGEHLDYETEVVAARSARTFETHIVAARRLAATLGTTGAYMSTPPALTLAQVHATIALAIATEGGKK